MGPASAEAWKPSQEAHLRAKVEAPEARPAVPQFAVCVFVFDLVVFNKLCSFLEGAHCSIFQLYQVFSQQAEEQSCLCECACGLPTSRIGASVICVSCYIHETLPRETGSQS